MHREREGLPGYEAICTIVGAVYVVLGGAMLARGAAPVMRPFGVPEAVLASPHFADFFHVVFVHMVVLGIVFALLGRYVQGASSQRVVARVLLLVEIHYTYLDVRTSDWPLGNALYRGPESVIPALIDFVVVLAFVYLSVRPAPTRTASAGLPSSIASSD